MPICLEKKRTLSGETQTYSCELLHFEKGFGVLRYVIDREYDIAGLKLVPGDVTIALYWEDRPYTLYLWLRKTGGAAYYFNIADQIFLSRQEFRWRDLAVDILVDPQGMVHVLDEHELPPDLEASLARSIQAAKDHVLDSLDTIIQEADRAVRQYRARSV
jgi:protein associated with RNAse G/E